MPLAIPPIAPQKLLTLASGNLVLYMASDDAGFLTAVTGPGPCDRARASLGVGKERKLLSSFFEAVCAGGLEKDVVGAVCASSPVPSLDIVGPPLADYWSNCASSEFLLSDLALVRCANTGFVMSQRRERRR